MIDIVIVNYNYGKYIIPLLNSLLKCQDVSFINQTITVVDNKSKDDSVQLITDWLYNKDFSCNLIMSENKGYAHAVNLGARINKSKYIMILNADMLVLDSFWKEKFIDTFESEKNIAVVGCKLIDQFKKVVGAGTMGTFQRRQFRAYGVNDSAIPSDIFNQPADCINVCGAAYMVRRDIFEKLGGFDEDFFMYYEEEFFSIKVQKLLGMKVRYIPYTTFLHYSNPSGKFNNENRYQRISGKTFIRKCKEIGIQGVQV